MDISWIFHDISWYVQYISIYFHGFFSVDMDIDATCRQGSTGALAFRQGPRKAPPEPPGPQELVEQCGAPYEWLWNHRKMGKTQKKLGDLMNGIFVADCW